MLPLLGRRHGARVVWWWPAGDPPASRSGIVAAHSVAHYSTNLCRRQERFRRLILDEAGVKGYSRTYERPRARKETSMTRSNRQMIGLGVLAGVALGAMYAANRQSQYS